MQIGSFIEMEFQKGKEYYNGNNIARLNSGRAGIYHAARVKGCDTVYLPYYLCDTVRDFLIKKQVQVRYYSINERFEPLIKTIPRNTAIVITNYYGIMSQKRLRTFSNNFENIIIDNAQAFFCKPVEGCLNVYSARKFIGVPDGSYVIGPDVERYIEDYQQDYSSDTSQFLLQRVEYGCEGKAYDARMLNEHRIDTSDIKKMSKLTHAILDGTNYEFIIKKRKENFDIACQLLNGINNLDVRMHYDDYCVPMVYPLVVENDALLSKLLNKHIFQGHWWSYLLNEVDESSFEYYMSRYLIPITIDQRYGRLELEYTHNIIEQSP